MPENKKKTKKNTSTQKTDNFSKVKIIQSAVIQQCQVGEKIIDTYQDCDTGKYYCQELPYQRFITLEDLGNKLANKTSKK